MEDLTIYIIDDDSDVLSSLNWMLEGYGFNTKCYASASDFLEAVSSQTVGVVIVDVQMPVMTGLELQNILNDQESSLGLIILTGHGTINMAVDAIKKGAIGFLEKPADGEKLKLLIQQAMQISQKLFDEKEAQKKLESHLSSLTIREAQVMGKVLEGKLNKVIALELEIAQRTVEIHRNKVMSKMNVSSVAELAFLVSRYKE